MGESYSSVEMQSVYLTAPANWATMGRSESVSNGNKGVLHIPQNSSITGASPSDYLVSYPGHSLGESYSSVEMQSMYLSVEIIIFRKISYDSYY